MCTKKPNANQPTFQLLWCPPPFTPLPGNISIKGAAARWVYVAPTVGHPNGAHKTRSVSVKCVRVRILSMAMSLSSSTSTSTSSSTSLPLPWLPSVAIHSLTHFTSFRFLVLAHSHAKAVCEMKSSQGKARKRRCECRPSKKVLINSTKLIHIVSGRNMRKVSIL